MATSHALPLQDFKSIRNCVTCCNKDGLLKTLETQKTELEMCEKVFKALLALDSSLKNLVASIAMVHT
jgi:hypothetical protein